MYFVGQEIGIIHNGTRSTFSGKITKVTKVNGFGHVTTEDGEVFDKHGKSRRQYSHNILARAQTVRHHLANKEIATARNKIFRELKATIEACESYGNIFVYESSVKKMQELVSLMGSFAHPDPEV
jgi:hypothetical protein